MRRAALAPLLLVVAVLAVYSASLPGPQRLTAHHDNLDGGAPLRLEAARQWREGRVPLWNPSKRAGMPLLADTTAGAIYPGNFPYLFAADPLEAADAGRSFDVFAAMDVVAALHAVLGALFLFAFLRATGLAPPAALLGGLVFGCAGTTTWFAAWYIQIQNSMVWLPAILLAVHRAAMPGTGSCSPAGAASTGATFSGATDGDPAAAAATFDGPFSASVEYRRAAALAAPVALGGAAVALQFFAGYPETSFYSGLLAIGYAASLVAPGRVLRPLLAVAAVYTAGILLAAVQLLPSGELQMLSRRPGALSLEAFQSLPASTSMFASWLRLPAGAGPAFPPAAAYHFGPAAIVLAALALARPSRLLLYALLVLVLGVLLALGDATPVSAWAWHIPGLSAFRHPHKHLFEVTFAMAVLAGLGAQVLLERRGRSLWVPALLGAAVLATALSLRGAHDRLVDANPAGVDLAVRVPALAAAVEPGWRILAQRGVFQARDPAFLIGDYPTQFRVGALHGAGPYLWSALAAATGTIEEEIRLRPGLLGPADRTLDLLAARYVVQVKSQHGFLPKVDPARWRVLAEDGDARLLEGSSALPRARFVAEARCADQAAIDTSLQGGVPAPVSVALLTCGGAGGPARSFGDPSAMQVRVASDRPGRIEMEVSVPTREPGFLVFSQADLPNWRARVDGADVAVQRVHGLVQGVEVPPGTRRVELLYRPRSLAFGATVSAGALVLLLTIAGIESVLRRDRPERLPSDN